MANVSVNVVVVRKKTVKVLANTTPRTFYDTSSVTLKNVPLTRGTFVNGQSISVNDLTITGALVANGENGFPNYFLKTDGNKTYWSVGTDFPVGVLVPGTPGIPAIPEIPAVEEVLDEEGNVITPASPGVPGVPGVPEIPAVFRAPTGEEVFDAIANGLLNGILNNTVSFEKEQAFNVATANVAPITISNT